MRSCGDRILLNGISSRRAHEHSTTATPACSTISRSAGHTTWVPLGLWACVSVNRGCINRGERVQRAS